MKLSTTQTRKNRINLILMQFSEGDTYPREIFEKICRNVYPNRTIKEGPSKNLDLVNIQTRINRVLRSVGLVLKSKNHYSFFYVTDYQLSVKELGRYTNTANNAKNRAKQLELGLQLKSQVVQNPTG